MFLVLLIVLALMFSLGAITHGFPLTKLLVILLFSLIGMAGSYMVAWFGIAAPRGVARDVQMKLHGELLRILRNPDFQKSMVAVGQEPAWQDTPERFYDFLKVESGKWAQVVKDSGATIQVPAEGPFQITYVNPADDPRQKKSGG